MPKSNSPWVYNTTVRSSVDNREYHVWERLYPNGEIRFVATNPKFGYNPPPPGTGSFGSSQGLFERTGLDIRGRESAAAELIKE